VRRLRIEPETQFLILAAAVGAAGALVNAAFRELLGLSQRAFASGAGSLFEPIGPSLWWIVVIATPALGGLAVGALGRATKTDIGGYGLPAFLEKVNLRSGEIDVRSTLLRTCAAALTLGSGGSAGVEGPIASLGGGMAAWIGRARRLVGERLRVMIACGSSAAVAAAYGAPIAGVFFTQEIVLAGNYDVQNFVRVVVAAGSATVVARAIRGDAPMFEAPQFVLESSSEVLHYLLLGLLCGLLGAWFSRIYFWTHKRFAASSIPPIYRPALGGALVGVLAIPAVGVLGTGHEVIEDLLHRTGAAGWSVIGGLAVLLVAKIVATSVTIGSGGAGGVFGPSLCFGALLGAILGGAADLWRPEASASPAHYSMVGMGAFLAATVRAPLTSIFLVFEMTGSSSTAVLPTLVAVAAALFVARRLERYSIDEAALAERGVHLAQGRDSLALSNVTVRSAMRAGFEGVPASATAPDLHTLISASSSSAFVVVDENDEMIGILSLQDLRVLDAKTAEALGALTIAADLCERKVVTVFADESLASALTKMDQFGYRQLPVVERDAPRRVIGMLERQHVLKAYRRHLVEQSGARADGRPASEGGETPRL
jgi:CIC family chloride channel protein